MAKVWSFHYNIGGIKYVCNVLRDDIGDAADVARKKCADRVGDNFKRDAMDDRYLEKIEYIFVEA